MTDATRSLSWYSGLAVVFFGIGPAVMVALLVARGNTPGTVGLLLIGGIPLVVLAAIAAVRGIRSTDPEAASRHLHLSLALVAGADVLLLGGNALIRMSSS